MASEPSVGQALATEEFWEKKKQVGVSGNDCRGCECSMRPFTEDVRPCSRVSRNAAVAGPQPSLVGIGCCRKELALQFTLFVVDSFRPSRGLPDWTESNGKAPGVLSVSLTPQVSL